MMRKNRIRWSLFTIVLSGVLGLIGLLLRGPVPLPNVDVNAWVKAVTQDTYFLAQALTLFAYVVPFFGFWGLYASLAEQEKVEKPAFWGFMTSIIGTSLAIATLGVFSYVSPYLAEYYLLGDLQSPDIITQIATGKPALINLFGGFLYLLGTGLLGWAVWRSELLPKWSGLLIAGHGLCLVFGFMFYPLGVLSWVFLLLAGLWLFINFDS